jgi:hypothetical protein
MKNLCGQNLESRVICCVLGDQGILTSHRVTFHVQILLAENRGFNDTSNDTLWTNDTHGVILGMTP